MIESFREQLKIAEAYFENGLPYWCDVFSRPMDEEFEKYLKSNGHNVQYLILELFDSVYIPDGCPLSKVEQTAKERAKLRATINYDKLGQTWTKYP